jgi:hypothetical protein
VIPFASAERGCGQTLARVNWRRDEAIALIGGDGTLVSHRLRHRTSDRLRAGVATSDWLAAVRESRLTVDITFT